jgi:hypothetical protein
MGRLVSATRERHLHPGAALTDDRTIPPNSFALSTKHPPYEGFEIDDIGRHFAES